MSAGQQPPAITREDELVQLILHECAAAKAVKVQSTTITLKIHVQAGELRNVDILSLKRWQPASARKRPAGR